jgi:hypothetical protein
MIRNFVSSLAFAAILMLIGPTGCSRGTAGPPPPLAVEQIPAELQKVYAKATPDVKELVALINTALQNKDYPVAHQDVQILCDMPGATKEQRLVAIRSSLTLTGLLQAAQAQGDEKAAAVLTQQKRMK